MLYAGRKYLSRGDKLFDFFNIALMAVISIIILYPFWNVGIISVSSSKFAQSLNVKIWPDTFSLDAYKMVLSTSTLPLAYRNTILRTAVGTFISVFFTMCASYVLAEKKLPYRKALTTFLFITMYIDGGLIPSYLLVRDLKLYNTFWALVIPGALSAYNIFLARNFIMSIPESLREAAHIDGANELTIMLKIIFPLSKPIIATLALWAAVGHWNAWFDAMIYTSKQELLVLQLLLKRTMDNAAGTFFGGVRVESMFDITAENVNGAVIMLTIGPIVLMYPFIQKYLIKGVMIGSIKG